MESDGCSAAAFLLSRFSSVVATFLIALFLIPGSAFAAPKPMDAATVRARIEKRGIDRWVAVKETNGIEIAGRILAIQPDSFTMQLYYNDPQPVTVMYGDVVDLRTGPSRAFWVATGAGLAAVTGMAIWGFVHVHDLNQQNQLPNLPPLP
jgi:hypothetical protein